MAETERTRGAARASITSTLRNVVDPFREFVQTEASGGVLLLICAVFALLWANSPWDDLYDDLFHTYITISVGDYGISASFAHWINDGLMAIFFLVVGLEIKREVLVGELASLRRAALPIAAAIGGMVVPALIYVAINAGGEGSHGWGIPMATDIAFSLGVLAVLGSRAPATLKVFLTALAIVDDIGAVLVIALFYTADVSLNYILLSAGILALLVIMNLLGVRRTMPYIILGIGLWIAVYQTGVHATVAGVLLALTIPARHSLSASELLARGRQILEEFEEVDRTDDLGRRILTDGRYASALHEVEQIKRALQSPLQQFEHSLHPWVAYLIVPLFALANAGVSLGGEFGSMITEPVTLGVIAGLFIGKQLGITGFTWLGVKTGLMNLPSGIGWRQIHAVACIAGIGFTMSLFIANLAFIGNAEHGARLLDDAKIGILVASLLSGVMGYILLRSSKPVREEAPE